MQKEELLNLIKDEMIGTTIISKKYGNGNIISINDDCFNINYNSFTVKCDIKFAVDIKTFDLYTGTKLGFLIVDESTQSKLKEYSKLGYQIIDDIKQVALENSLKEAEALNKRAELEKIAYQEQKKKEAFEALKARNEKQFEDICNEEIINTYDYFVALGYVAKHATNITAAMPDYMEAKFVEEFGDVNRRVVDSTAVGPSGYTSQWRLSMNISLNSNTNIPDYLVEYLSKTDKKIRPVSNLSFICGLLKNFGFKIGKKQDLSLIKSKLPVGAEESFDIGYNL